MKRPGAMTLTEARSHLLEVAERFERPSAAPVEVTKRGKPIMMLVPAKTYEAMRETLEILAGEETAAGIRRGLADLDAGRTIPWEKVREKLGL
jgi:prevent-host-death family protein